jgi:hypothetical protein
MAKDKVRVQTKLTIEKVKPGIDKAGKGGRTFKTEIEVVGAVHLAEIQKLLGDEHVYNMLEPLFDAEGGLHTDALEQIKIATIVKDATVTLGDGNLRTQLKDSLIDSIQLVPKPGRLFDLKAKIHTNPTPKQNNTIEYELLQDTVKVIIEGGERVNEGAEQAEIPLEPAGAAA